MEDWRLDTRTWRMGVFAPINSFQQGHDFHAVVELPGVSTSGLEVQAKDGTIRTAGTQSINSGDRDACTGVRPSQRLRAGARQAFLDRFAARLGAEEHVAMILDQADWHVATALVVPESVTLPPHAPEPHPRSSCRRRPAPT